MNRVHYRSLFILLLALALPPLAGGVLAQGVFPEVAFVAEDDGIEFPAEFPAGLVTIAIENNRTENPYGPLFGRLNEDVTMDEFMAALGEESPLAALALVTLYGGSEVPPGESLSFIVDFPAGNYIAAEFSAEVPTIETFTVLENDAMITDLPEVDVTVVLDDFVFGIDDEQAAGPQTWLLENQGEQWHEMGVFIMEDGITTEALHAELMAANPEEQLPYEPVFFWAPMGPEGLAWVTLDLEPGTYAVICFLPDLASEEGTPHFAHGMAQVFTVAE